MDKKIYILNKQYRIFGDEQNDIKFQELGYFYNSAIYPITNLKTYIKTNYGADVNVNNIFNYIKNFHFYNSKNCACKDCLYYVKHLENVMDKLRMA